jgi:hypothetical protein
VRYGKKKGVTLQALSNKIGPGPGKRIHEKELAYSSLVFPLCPLLFSFRVHRFPSLVSGARLCARFGHAQILGLVPKFGNQAASGVTDND